jgi:hypothetical protein
MRLEEGREEIEVSKPTAQSEDNEALIDYGLTSSDNEDANGEA